MKDKLIERLVDRFEQKFVCKCDDCKALDAPQRLIDNTAEGVLDEIRAALTEAYEAGARHERERVLAVIAKHREELYDPYDCVDELRVLSPSTEAKGCCDRCKRLTGRNFVPLEFFCCNRDCPCHSKGVNEK